MDLFARITLALTRLIARIAAVPALLVVDSYDTVTVPDSIAAEEQLFEAALRGDR